MGNKYIRIKIAPYCLPKLLYTLNNNGVKDITITMEDNELYVVLNNEELDEIVYPQKKSEISNREALFEKALEGFPDFLKSIGER